MTDHEASISPADDRCVWVSAGLLTDHVCDRDFDCDGCPLHQALARVAGRKESHRFPWPKDRLYSEGHFWLKPTSDHTARVGLTETAVSLLHPVTNWKIDASATGQPIVIATLGCGRAVLAPPLGACRFAANPCLEVDALWPAADAWLSGYLMDVEFAHAQENAASWLKLPDVAPQYAHHRELIHRALQRVKVRPAELAAAGTADGGLPVSGLLPVLGGDAYAGLLASILGCGFRAR